MLRAAGAPTIDTDVVSDTRMRIGTMIHTDFEDALRGQPAMLEVKLDPWMPEGWSGTADWIVWDPDKRAFVLGDLKSIKPEGLAFINRDGAKEDHVWQISSYFWALVNMGLPLVHGFVIYYLPTGQLRARDGFVQPSMQEGTPIAQHLVEGRMKDRWEATKEYLDSIGNTPAGSSNVFVPEVDDFLTNKLAPVQDRVQKRMKPKKDHPGVEDVLLVPHWSCAYCPYPTTLCNCKEQGTTKIGSYSDGTYIPRIGYEDIDPEV